MFKNAWIAINKKPKSAIPKRLTADYKRAFKPGMGYSVDIIGRVANSETMETCLVYVNVLKTEYALIS